MLLSLGDWREKQGLSYRELNKLLGVSGNDTSRRYCLPHGHPEYRIPRPSEMTRIYLATGGQVQPNDFYDLPALAAQPEEAAA